MQAVTMKFKPTAFAAALLLGSLNAQAALTSYTNDGVDLVYSSVSDVTWTKDANLFKTMYDADNTLISKIAAVTPSYNDPSYGLQTISDSSVKSGDYDDFNTSNGLVSWWGALAFVNYLNHISYGGSTQWYLPTVANTSIGYTPPTNGTTKGDELPELFYSELGGNVASSIPNTATFDNEQAYVYWSGTEYAPYLGGAWYFRTNNGFQDVNLKDFRIYAWAVSPGMISSIPEADTTAMLLAGLGVMGAVLRRRHAG